MSGSLTGSKTSEVTLPKWYEDAAKTNIAGGQKVAQAGFTPYMGPDVAAFQPQQLSAMQSSSDWLSGFGMGPKRNIAASIPAPQSFAGGIKGYSSAPMYFDALNQLKVKMPGLYNYLKSFQINPTTGADAGITKKLIPATPAPAAPVAPAAPLGIQIGRGRGAVI